MKKQKKTILLVVAIVLIGVVLGFVLSQNSSEKALKKQLDLGIKFLTEQDYEQAIINFKKAIEIDPMSSEAYFGLADAYVGNGDFETAISTLEDAIKFFEENGQDATVLKDKLTTVRMEQQVREEEEKLAAIPFVAIQPILDAASDVWGRNWDEWTVDDFRRTFNLQTYYRDNGELYESDSDSNYTISYTGNNTTTMMEWGPPTNYFGHSERMNGIYISIVDTEKVGLEYIYSQVIGDSENPYIIDRALHRFVQTNGITNLDSFILYLGLNNLVYNETLIDIRTEYGPAKVSLYETDNFRSFTIRLEDCYVNPIIGGISYTEEFFVLNESVSFNSQGLGLFKFK